MLNALFRLDFIQLLYADFLSTSLNQYSNSLFNKVQFSILVSVDSRLPISLVYLRLFKKRFAILIFNRKRIQRIGVPSYPSILTKAVA